MSKNTYDFVTKKRTREYMAERIIGKFGEPIDTTALSFPGIECLDFIDIWNPIGFTNKNVTCIEHNFKDYHTLRELGTVDTLHRIKYKNFGKKFPNAKFDIIWLDFMCQLYKGEDMIRETIDRINPNGMLATTLTEGHNRANYNYDKLIGSQLLTNARHLVNAKYETMPDDIYHSFMESMLINERRTQEFRQHYSTYLFNLVHTELNKKSLFARFSKIWEDELQIPQVKPFTIGSYKGLSNHYKDELDNLMILYRKCVNKITVEILQYASDNGIACKQFGSDPDFLFTINNNVYSMQKLAINIVICLQYLETNNNPINVISHHHGMNYTTDINPMFFDLFEFQSIDSQGLGSYMPKHIPSIRSTISFIHPKPVSEVSAIFNKFNNLANDIQIFKFDIDRFERKNLGSERKIVKKEIS